MVDLLWEGLEKGEDMLGVRRALRSIVASRERRGEIINKKQKVLAS